MNEKRQANGLELLPVHVVPMVPADDDNADGDTKLSSTSIRRNMLGVLLKPPLVSLDAIKIEHLRWILIENA